MIIVVLNNNYNITQLSLLKPQTLDKSNEQTHEHITQVAF